MLYLYANFPTLCHSLFSVCSIALCNKLEMDGRRGTKTTTTIIIIIIIIILIEIIITIITTYSFQFHGKIIFRHFLQMAYVT